MEYTAVVAMKKKRFIMIKHKNRGWEWPGGTLERNEGVIECARREFLEETGYELTEPKEIMILKSKEGTCHVIAGKLGRKVAEPGDSMIEGIGFFEKLPGNLSFPDDPYDEILATVKVVQD